MPDNDVFLSARESEFLEAYARLEGVTPEAALKKLYTANLKNRLDFRGHRGQGEVKTFRLPERD